MVIGMLKNRIGDNMIIDLLEIDENELARIKKENNLEII